MRQNKYNMNQYIIMNDVYIIGCGGNSKVIVEICELNKYVIKGFFDDRHNLARDNGHTKYKIIGTTDDIKNYPRIKIINSIGDNEIRKKICDKLNDENLNLEWINCIHPDSHISTTVKLGMGNIICYGSFINSCVSIGNFNLLNTYSIVEHDSIICDFNHVAPRTTLCGNTFIGNINLLGASSTFIPNKRIGNKNIIGAMTLIIDNFGDNNLIVGIPGTIKKKLV